MPGKINQVNKMLSPEEVSLLGTVQSSISELLNLQTADAGNAPADGNAPVAEKTVVANAEPEDDKKEVDKANEGPSANDTAAQRIADQTDINNKNMSEVGKMLINILSQSAQKNITPVNKSMDTVQFQDNNNANFVASVVVKALEPVIGKINEMEKFNSNIIDALGFSQKIEKSITDITNNTTVNKAQNLPGQGIDATGVVNELVNVMKTMATNNVQNNSVSKNDWNGNQQARKELSKALPLIFKNGIKSNQ